MIPLLAQAVPEAAALASWISVLMYLGGFVATLLACAVAWKNLRAKPSEVPQPLHVKHADTFATKDDHKSLKVEIDKIDNERRTSVANLHAKIDANTATTVATNATVNQMNLQLQALNAHLLRQAAQSNNK